MPITIRQDSDLTPFFHLALGRMEAKRNQQITSDQYKYETNAQILQAVSDFSADQKEAFVSASAGAGAVGGKMFDTFAGGMGGGMGGGGGGAGAGAGSGLAGTPRKSDDVSPDVSPDRPPGDQTDTQKPTDGPKLIDPYFGGNIDLSTREGQIQFNAAVDQNREAQAVWDRQQAVAGARSHDLLMEGLSSGALADSYRIGHTPAQQTELAGLQNGRNLITHGTGNAMFDASSGWNRLSKSQQGAALAAIDARSQEIVRSIGLVQMTPEEKAAKARGSIKDQFDNEIVEDGTRGLGKDRNGTFRVLYDDAKELLDAEKIIDERVEKRNYGTAEIPRNWDDLTEDEQVVVKKRERDRLHGSIFGDRKAKQDRAQGKGGEQGGVTLGADGTEGSLTGTDALQRGLMKPQPLPPVRFSPDGRRQVINKNDFVLGQVYTGTDHKTKKQVTGIWDGNSLDTNIGRGKETVNAFIDEQLKKAEAESRKPRLYDEAASNQAGDKELSNRLGEGRQAKGSKGGKKSGKGGRDPIEQHYRDKEKNANE